MPGWGKHRTRARLSCRAHLALWFGARKDANVIQQGGRAAGALQHFEGRPGDGQFVGAGLEVRSVLRMGVICAAINNQRMSRASHSYPAPARQTHAHLVQQLGGRHRVGPDSAARRHFRPRHRPLLGIVLGQHEGGRGGHHAALACDEGTTLRRVPCDHDGANVALLWKQCVFPHVSSVQRIGRVCAHAAAMVGQTARVHSLCAPPHLPSTLRSSQASRPASRCGTQSGPGSRGRVQHRPA